MTLWVTRLCLFVYKAIISPFIYERFLSTRTVSPAVIAGLIELEVIIKRATEALRSKHNVTTELIIINRPTIKRVYGMNIK